VSVSAGILRFLQAPIVFVTGKGGVGKTTTAAAVALASARAGQRAALVEFDDPEAGQRALRGADAQVHHEVATYDRCLETTIAPLVGGSMVAKAVLKQKPIRSMTRAMPAMRELVSLERVRMLLASGDFDRVVVDLPASGHALDWLRVPKAFERFLLGGPLGRVGTRIHDEVVASGRSDVVFVTLAEPLVMAETQQLAVRFHKELGRSPSLVVINRVMRPDPAGAQEAADKLAQASGAPAAAELARLLRARADAAREAMDALRMARGLDTVKVIAMPEEPTDPPLSSVVRWLDEGASR
jgi:anion-transporting  ArsA/GET3 family ATPase